VALDPITAQSNGIPELQCINVACSYAADKKCVENHPIPGCPYLQTPKSVKQEEKEELVLLSSGECLNTDQCLSVQRSGKSRVLAIIGPSDSGKTSLIASFYDLFQFSLVQDFGFSGSRTLFDFERACHTSRSASAHSQPAMGHTPFSPSGVKYYQLGVFERDSRQCIDFLIADRNGEDYSGLVDDAGSISEFAELQRADSITVLVNGEKLLNNVERHNVVQEIKLILQRLQESEVISRRQRLVVVLTKLDALSAADDLVSARARSDFQGLVTYIRSRFDNLFCEIHDFEVAASPKTDILPYCYGIASLIPIWSKVPGFFDSTEDNSQSTTRSFDKFGRTGEA
jgi:hypothetical protein